MDTFIFIKNNEFNSCNYKHNILMGRCVCAWLVCVCACVCMRACVCV